MSYEKTIEQLKWHEGLRLEPYKCSEGFLTIGYGRNLETKGITKDEAEEMLLNDLSYTVQKLIRAGLLTDDRVGPREAVLINMAYQLGYTGFSKFKNMIDAYRRQEWELAAKEMKDSLWYRQTPNRAKELIDQMITGEYQ